MTKSNKSKAPFITAVIVLILAIVIPVVLLIVSTVLNKNANDELNKSLYPIKYEKLVEKAAKEYNVDICLVYGIIRTESGFDPEALSQAGAIGLMQIMPDTFIWLQNYRSDFMPEEIIDSDELYKPEINIDYGVFLLSYLLEYYEGNIPLVICSYNAGYGNVDDWLANGTLNSNAVTAEDVPFPETSNYLTKVTTAMDMYRALYFAENTDSDTSGSDENSEQNITENEISDITSDEEIQGSYIDENSQYGDVGDDNYYNYDYQDDDYYQWD